MSVHRSSTMALSALALLAGCLLRSMSVRASDGPGNTRMTTGVSVGMPVLLGGVRWRRASDFPAFAESGFVDGPGVI